MEWQNWVRRVYQAVDGMDAEKACGFLTDDVVLRYGNQEPWKGREVVQEALTGFFGTIGGQHHEFTGMWKVDDTIILHGDVDYIRLDQRAVTVPFAVIYGMADDERARSVDILVDATEVFTP